MIFIDTNVLVRVIVQDNPSQTKKAVAFIEQIRDKKIEVLVENAVIAEVVWVTSSPKLYAMKRAEIVGKLSVILSLDHIQHDNKPELLNALKIYAETKFDFVDCLVISYKQAGIIESVMTFDRALNKALETG
jgi:predicted nucleic-acid-binding protein